MGDRGNIAIAQPATGVNIYLYTHWSGYRVNESLAAGLDRGRGRWSDRPYLTRILFDTLVDDAEPRGTTGFGIDTEISDNEYPIPVVDTDAEVVTLEGRSYTFEQFIAKYGEQ